jgi:methionine-rich copper-binding protein CopC
MLVEMGAVFRCAPRLAVVMFLAALVGLATSNVAQAHTDFDFSLPADGASVGLVLSEVTVAFTEPVTLVGTGFEVIDPQSAIRVPFAVTDDNMIFRLQLDPPLAGGGAGVSYVVTAADGHVLSGTFSFTVPEVPDQVAITTAPPSSAAAPATTAPSTTEALAGVTGTTTEAEQTAVDDGGVAAGADAPVALDAVPVARVNVPVADPGGLAAPILVIVAASVIGGGAIWALRSRRPSAG